MIARKQQISLSVDRDKWELLHRLAGLRKIPVTRYVLGLIDWPKLTSELRELEDQRGDDDADAVTPKP